MNKDILLMTSAIKVDKRMLYHKHIPENERLREYIESILYYIIKSNFSDIVFIDWSGFDLSILSFLNNIASIYNKKIELLSFKYDTDTVINKGKWYWENIILEYGVNNSTLLNNYTSFYKVTWRYKVKNINSILKKHEKKNNIFIKNLNSTCNTAFFKVEKKTFKKYFVWAGERVSDRDNVYLEHVYYDIIKKENFWVQSFSELPYLSGISWGGRSLDNNLKYTVKLILRQLGFFKF